ncbi:MAG TPA: DUF6600 domain-containing protein [Verrucomicrobiae bacterium]|jgi:hypothetical protein
MKKIVNFIRRGAGLGASMLAAAACLTAGSIAHAQATTLSPDLQEILKFSQAHMTDDVITAYIKNSGKNYTISADQMLFLNGQGVSQPVISALVNAKPPTATAPAPAPTPAPAPAPAPAAPPPAAPAPAPAPMPAPPPAGLTDFFNAEGGLNPALWSPSGNILSYLAAINGSPPIMPALMFGPSGMQMSGISGPGQFSGVQTVTAYAAPFTLTARVTSLSDMAIPFEVYLVSPDQHQWFSLAGHIGGRGHHDGEVRVGGAIPFLRGAVDIPIGERPSPDHGVWVNYTSSGLPIALLGNKIAEHAAPGIPYTIQLTVGPDGMGSVSFMDAAGVTLGARGGMPVGMGPFHVVLAERNGPTVATWQSAELVSLAPPPPPPAAVAPPVPTFDYFQAQLNPYGHWIDVAGIGAAWVPNEASIPGWRPYVDAGHWEYTDAGWFWHSDYAWGEIGFHYGRWLNDARTGFVWAWAPQYDWAPSWVAWRYGDGGMGWAPLPWEARFHEGVGIEWNGAVAVDVDFGLRVDAFVFIGSDHFFDHDYRHVMYDREASRRFYEHSEIHNGYHVDHGHFVAEGWGREHVSAMTHHEVAVHQVHEMRVAEEHHNIEARREAHPELARAAAERGRPGVGERERERPGMATPGHPGAATPGHPGGPAERKPVQQPKSKGPQNEKRPEEGRKPQ